MRCRWCDIFTRTIRPHSRHLASLTWRPFAINGFTSSQYALRCSTRVGSRELGVSERARLGGGGGSHVPCRRPVPDADSPHDEDQLAHRSPPVEWYSQVPAPEWNPRWNRRLPELPRWEYLYGDAGWSKLDQMRDPG